MFSDSSRPQEPCLGGPIRGSKPKGWNLHRFEKNRTAFFGLRINIRIKKWWFSYFLGVNGLYI
jgi:hypothetical protein